MRVTVRMIAVMSVAALATMAVAQDEDGRREPPREAKIGEPAPEIRASNWVNGGNEVSLDQFKHRIILLFFFKTTDRPSMDEAVPILNKVHQEQGSKGVVVIGLIPQSKEDADGAVTEKDIKFIVGYGANTTESYKVAAFPMVYMIDAAGVLVDRFHPGDHLPDKLEAQIRKTPPPAADARALQNRFRKASTAFSSGQYGKAYTEAKGVQELTDEDSSLGRAAANLIEQIEQAAEKWLDEARDAIRAEEYAKACRIATALSVRFAGTDTGGEAENVVGRLMGNREVKPQVRKALDNARGELLNDRAADCEDSQHYLDALRLYRETSEEYPETDAAEAAQRAVDRITSDSEAQRIIAQRRAEQQADRWLDLADRFAKVKMYGKARAYYERIRAEYPTTPAGSKVAGRLANLPEDEPEEEEAEADEEKDASADAE